MVGSSAPTSDSNPPAAGGGASKYLANLPSRGLFSSTVLSSNPGGMRVYICDHDTAPPVRRKALKFAQQVHSPGRGFAIIAWWWYSVNDSNNDQLIKTNQTNILIRSLMLKKQKGDSSSKDIKGASPSEASRKRPAERALDGRASTKRGATNNQAGSRQEGSRTRVPEKDFQSLTVERLRALLKEKGLSRNGKKDELIARLRSANGQS